MLEFIVMLLIVGAIIFIGIKDNNERTKRMQQNLNKSTNGLQQPVDRCYPPPDVVREKEALFKIQQNNPSFINEHFKKYAESVYIRYFSSITQQNPSAVKELLSENLYNAHVGYLEGIKAAQRNICIENVVVRKILIDSYEFSNNIETISVVFTSKMSQYETDNEGLIISGYRSCSIEKIDKLTFQRNYNELNMKMTCHNCGAKIESFFGNCQYCGAVIKFDDTTNEGWVLCDVATL